LEERCIRPGNGIEGADKEIHVLEKREQRQIRAYRKSQRYARASGACAARNSATEKEVSDDGSEEKRYVACVPPAVKRERT
jgi:hypothetical protein